MRADIAQHELIAVGPGSSDAGSARHSSGAADVFNDNLLAEDFGERWREDSSQHVDSAPGAKWDHHSDWPIGPVLRRRGSRADDSKCKPDRNGMG
jgi:hypothetical protein